jgi:hypothetical protein
MRTPKFSAAVVVNGLSQLILGLPSMNVTRAV